MGLFSSKNTKQSGKGPEGGISNGGGERSSSYYNAQLDANRCQMDFDVIARNFDLKDGTSVVQKIYVVKMEYYPEIRCFRVTADTSRFVNWFVNNRNLTSESRRIAEGWRHTRIRDFYH